MKSTKQMRAESEAFFAEAFCADSAKMILNRDAINSFRVQAVIEIDTGDKRGVIHVAHVTKAED